MWFCNDMIHYMLKAEFVKSPVGSSLHFPPTAYSMRERRGSGGGKNFAKLGQNLLTRNFFGAPRGASLSLSPSLFDERETF